MASSYGNNIRITIFGQSHGKAIGVTIEGLPPGMKVDGEALQAFLARRAAVLQGKPRTKSPFPCNTFFLCYNTHATGAFIKS